MYELQVAKLPRVFESLLDYVAAVLEIMKQEHPTRPVVELDEREQVVNNRPHPETPTCSHMKMINAAFVTSLFWFRDSGRIKISVPCASGLISMKLLYPNKRQRLLRNPASLPLLTVPEKEKDVLEMTDAVASIDFSVEGRRVMVVLSEAMNPVCYT